MAESVDRQREATAGSPGRRGGWVIPVLGLVVLVAVVWYGFTRLSAGALHSEIPALPDFSRSTPAIEAQITAADAAARRDPRSGAALGRLGMVYHANSFDQRARIAYQLARRVNPESFRWLYCLAILDMTSGENERALAFLTQALELDADYPHAWARLGQIMFHRGAVAEAEEAFHRALALSPNHPHATLGLARLAGLRQEWGEVVRLLEDAVRVNPSFGPAHGVLAVAYGHLGRAEEARRHEGRGADAGFQMDDSLLQELYELSSTGSILVTRAQIAQNQGALERAGALLRRAVEVAPADKDVRLAIGRFLASAGPANPQLLQQAKRHFEAGLKIDPTYVHTRHEYAAVLYALGELAAAQAQWEQILQEEPKHAVVLCSLGQLWLRRKDYQRARDFYRRGLDTPPDTAFNLGNPGLMYYRFGIASKGAGFHEEALEAFRQAVRHDPRLCDVYIEHARLLREMGRGDEALDVCRQGVSANPGDFRLRQGLGSFLVQAKRFPEALLQLRFALRLRPQEPKTLAAIGFAELESNNVAAAIEHLQAAVRIDPKYVLAHYHLGNALLRAGRRAEAIEHYEAALRLRPDWQQAQAALAKAKGER